MTDETDKNVEEECEDTRTLEETSAVGGVLEGSFDHEDDASPVEEEIAREKDAAREEE